MIRPQLILDLNSQLVIDNFAGGGGASTGIERALGRHVDHAINHSAEALGMHRINHPQTVHHCEDVFDIDPTTLTEGRPVGMAWFSPDCKHFSKAKGGKPLDKRIRGLVLVMLRWAKIRCRVMFMENVEEIVTWGPLIELEKDGVKGWYPDPKHKGRTWRAFLACLGSGIEPDHPDLPEILEVLDGSVTREECIRGFGYSYETREIRACDMGAPTIRKRLFMIARCDGKAIAWPHPSYFDPKLIRKATGALRKAKPWRAIAECIDWYLPCPSIFLDAAQAKAAKCRRPLADSTLKRIAKGIDRYVIHAEEPFLVSLTHQGGDRIEPTSEPSKTITGAHRGEKALCVPTVVNSANGKTTGRGPNVWPVDEPMRTATSSPSFNVAKATLAPFVTEHANASTQRNMPVDEPMRTACAQVKGGHFAVVSANLMVNTSGHSGAKADAPAPTIPTGGHHAVVTGTLVHTAHGEQDKNGRKRGRGAHDIRETMPTVLASPDNALAAASLVKLRGDNIGSDAREPMHTASAGGTHHGIVAASVVRHFGESVGQNADNPAHTIMPGGQGKTGLLSAYLAQHNGGFNETPGHAGTEPISTISAKGSQQQVVAASLAAYYGNDEDGQAITEPARTVTTKDRLGFVESACTQCMTPEQIAGAHRVAAFLRAHGVVFEGEFATVAGFVIVDIGMRMLTPRELFRAQGFPEDYVIDRAWLINPKTGELLVVPLTKEQQIRMCGNSVCPNVAEELVRANVPELAVHYPGDLPRRKRAVAPV